MRLSDTVTNAILQKYLDFGERGIADVRLPSGERLMLSFAPTGFSVHRLHIFGFLPGRSRFKANRDDTERMTHVIARDMSQLPPLPKATMKHRDESAMNAFLDAATTDLKALAKNKRVPGAVDALDLAHPTERPLSLFSRLALTARDEDELVRLYERTRNTSA